MFGTVGILVSLGLLIFLAYRGITVLVLAPLLAIVAVLFNGGVPVLASYTEIFMTSFAGYAKAYFPLFLLGAIFGKVMDDSGSARSIAAAIVKRLGKDKAILAIVLSCALLTYGGVSLFVVAFAVYPIAAALFREAEIPKRLIPGSIALGSFTFTMTALPGSSQIQNAIPMPYFGTDTYAAPIIGIVGALIMFGGGVAWLNYRAKRAQSQGKGYTDGLKASAVATIIETNEENTEVPAEVPAEVSTDKGPGFFTAMLPVIMVLGFNFALSKMIFPQMDLSYLEAAPYNTTADKVIGQWSLILAVSLGIICTLALHWRRFKQPTNSINQGALGSLLAIINTCSEVGYGNVISKLPAFDLIKNGMLGISKNPLISESISISVLAGITGSASGGMSIALEILGDTYLDMAQAVQLNPEVLHRVATIACGSLDALPHNGAVITLLAICGLSHKQSYADIGMVAVVIPVGATIAAVVLGSFGVV